MKRIVVPLDGSPLAEAALPLAEALARDHEAALVLLRALTPQTSSAAEAAAQEEAEAYLAAAVEGVRGRGVAEAEWKVWYGAPARAIADAADQHGADLIAMATHGRSGLGRLVLGSVAESVVRRAPAPVLLVRGEPSWTTRPGRLLVPLDGSRLSEAVLPLVAGLAGPFDLGIDLLRVVAPLPTGAGAEITDVQAEELIAAESAESDRYLAKHAAALEAKGLRVRCATRVGAVVDVIAQFVSHEAVGLVAMSTHGRSGLGRLLLGSVAERVLRTVSVPVLLWKARELEEEAGRVSLSRPLRTGLVTGSSRAPADADQDAHTRRPS